MGVLVPFAYLLRASGSPLFMAEAFSSSTPMQGDASRWSYASYKEREAYISCFQALKEIKALMVDKCP